MRQGSRLLTDGRGFLRGIRGQESHQQPGSPNRTFSPSEHPFSCLCSGLITAAAQSREGRRDWGLLVPGPKASTCDCHHPSRRKGAPASSRILQAQFGRVQASCLTLRGSAGQSGALGQVRGQPSQSKPPPSCWL